MYSQLKPDNIWKFSSYLTENMLYLHYRDQLILSVHGS
jgi:hypothetical protein